MASTFTTENQMFWADPEHIIDSRDIGYLTNQIAVLLSFVDKNKKTIYAKLCTKRKLSFTSNTAALLTCLRTMLLRNTQLCICKSTYVTQLRYMNSVTTIVDLRFCDLLLYFVIGFIHNLINVRTNASLIGGALTGTSINYITALYSALSKVPRLKEYN